VTVRIALNPAKAITSFSFAGIGFIGTINEAAKTISVPVYGTGVSSLTATFTTTGMNVRVGSTVQVSGVTVNDFSSPVGYTVMAEDGTTVNYTVIVTVSAPPDVGASFEGGIVAYIWKSGDPGYVSGQTHGLIASAADLSPGMAWSNIVDVEVTETEWGIGTGAANTDAIIAQAGHTNSAAKLCRDYRGGGYDDWYLPSANEIPLLNANRTAIGGFSPAWYWSSTNYDYSPTDVVVQDFGDGRMNANKASSCRVRAVRSF